MLCWAWVAERRETDDAHTAIARRQLAATVEISWWRLGGKCDDDLSMRA